MDPDLPRRWLVLSVAAPARGEEHLLVEALLRVGGRSVVRDGERFVARIPVAEAEGGPDALLGEAEMAVRAATSLVDPEIRWRWTARRGDDGPEAGAPVPRHPTTRSCLAFLGELVIPGERWLDVGTGTGVLALEAARLGATEVLALERDPVTAALARKHAADAPGGRVRVVTLRAGPGDLGRLGPFHGIVANIEAGVLTALLEGFRREGTRDVPDPGPLHPDGRLILSGAHRGEGRELMETARGLGLIPVGERVEEGWWTGAFRYGGAGDG
jgi:SAM-dependent methyltransferase